MTKREKRGVTIITVLADGDMGRRGGGSLKIGGPSLLILLLKGQHT
jgi:hypothetical protein